MEENRLKVLIVDDERANILALAFILKETYDILVAKDGEAAIDVAFTQKPDLILLDVVMPGMNGFDVLTKLKESDITRPIPVIFITGRDSTADEETGFFLGAVDYITKPFHDSIVLARVRTHLQMVEYIRTIEKLGRIDALTNIANRRSFDEQLKKEWERAIREATPLSLLMIDVDKFKLYNDTYGHPQGDILLKSIAENLRQTLKRPADFPARWGGEEFTALLPNTELEGAMEVAEMFRESVEKTVVVFAGKETSATVSIGVNTEFPVYLSSLDEFLSMADKALYRAKSGGRNRVCAASVFERV